MDGVMGGHRWLLNPRFVRNQGSSRKPRVIDDAKVSFLNLAYTSTVKLQLQDTDFIAAMSYELMNRLVSNCAPVSESWLGKCFDLSKAYKQVSVLPSHRRWAVDFPGHDGWRFYRSLSLPFGATGSVYGFVRISAAIWWVITKTLKAVVSHYFDDFPTISSAAGSQVLDKSIMALLDILGWEFAANGDKAMPFCECFDALGARHVLTRIG